MRRVRYIFTTIISCAVLLGSCGEYDDSKLWNELKEQAERIAALEQWQTTVNGQISSLQDLTAALENNDYVTGVTPATEGGVEIGYTITFAKGDPITIRHGDKGNTGATGADGDTPAIGVKQDTDDIYYWTLDGEWLTDEDDKKMPVTGEKGESGTSAVAPQVKIDVDSNEWMVSTDGGDTWTSTGVKATGDSFFSDVDYTSNDGYVVFTLADGETTITLPKVNTLTIGFDSYEALEVNGTTRIDIVLPSTLKEGDFNAFIAEVSHEDGSKYMSIATRSTNAVQIVEPTFSGEGVYNGDAAVILNPYAVANGGFAVLKVTLIDNNGQEVSTSRIVEFSALIAAAANGGEITLQKDYNLEEPLVIAAGKEVTLDLNDNDIINTTTRMAIVVEGKLTINGNGSVYGGSGGDNQAIHVKSGGELTINGGSYNVGPDANNLGNSCIETSGGSIEIYGGTFKSEAAYSGRYFVLNQKNDNPGTITVYGGTFINYDPAQGDDSLGGNFVANGYTSVNVSTDPYVYEVQKNE